MMKRFAVFAIAIALQVSISTVAAEEQVKSTASTQKLKYVRAPIDNPLKGLVPYSGASADNRFPHSMEFGYLPLSDLMKGMTEFEWQPLEDQLDAAASRGHQAVFRIWMEYPGHTDGIPKFLEDDGLAVTEWEYTNTAPFPVEKIRTPDYEDPKLIAALESFIAALGKKYDGDPRIACVTAGLLGAWGEWHTYPREKLMASKKVQRKVMNAYKLAFTTTHILLRYPAGNDDYAYAENHEMPFGYHDDSFAWATLDTGKSEDDWFYVAALKRAGAINKWRKRMIGGEVRPELWAKIFDKEVDIEKAQDFDECVRQTHVTWLMETGMFSKDQSPERVKRAKAKVAKMGYEFHIARVERKDGHFGIVVKNTGVAPFYYDWDVELGRIDDDGKVIKLRRTDWKITDLFPGESRRWTTRWESGALAVRIRNPMPNGKPLRFANEESLYLDNGWLKLQNETLSTR